MIDEGIVVSPPHRVTQELSELADDIAIVESFSHLITFRTDDGLVTFDTCGVQTGPTVVRALRSWSKDPVHTMVYTHGHPDQVGGSGSFAADADEISTKKN